MSETVMMYVKLICPAIRISDFLQIFILVNKLLLWRVQIDWNKARTKKVCLLFSIYSCTCILLIHTLPINDTTILL